MSVPRMGHTKCNDLVLYELYSTELLKSTGAENKFYK